MTVFVRYNKGTCAKEQACNAPVCLPPRPCFLEDEVHSTETITLCSYEKKQNYVLGNIKCFERVNEKSIFFTWTEFFFLET